MTFEEMRQIILSFPDIQETIVFDKPTFRVHRRFVASFSHVDNTVCLTIPNKLLREYLLQKKSHIYSSTSQDDVFGTILIRIAEIDMEEFRKRCEEAWLSCAPTLLVEAYQDTHQKEKVCWMAYS